MFEKNGGRAMELLIEKGIISKIKDITVYRGGAFITRTAKVNLNKGRNAIVLDKLSATIKHDSIQIGVAQSVSCLQVSYVPDQNKYTVDTRVDIVDTEVDEKIREIQKKLKVIELQLELVKAIDVKFNINDGIDKIQRYTEYSASKMEELLSEEAKLRKEMEVLEKKKKAETSIKTSGIWKILPGVIKLELESDEEQETEIELQYFDISADWTPHYDIRLDDTKKTVSFVLKGNIAQTTGESWMDASISVSTGKFSQRRYKGELPVWRVNHTRMMDRFFGSIKLSEDMDDDCFYDEADEEESCEEIKKLSVPGFLAPVGATRSAISSRVAGPSASYETDTSDNTIIDNQNSVIYKLADKCTVLNAKGSGTVTVINHEIPCIIDIYTTPKLDCSAFMVAKVKDYAKYSFIKCNANIFFNNRFVGQTLIDPVGDDGIMLVSLGQDNKILVKRIVEKQLSSKSFIGGTQVKEELYSIKVANKKPIPAHLIIVDQIPVSSDAKVTVETTTLSKGIVEDTTGKVTWEIDLNPDEEVDLRLGFKIITKR